MDRCFDTGQSQQTGTCWFNAALNGLLQGYGCRKLLRYLVRDVKENAHLSEDSCPIDMDRRFILSVIRKRLCDPSFDPSYDLAKRTIKSMGRKHFQRTEGGQPIRGVRAILGALGIAYEEVTSEVALDPTKEKIHLTRDVDAICIKADEDETYGFYLPRGWKELPQTLRTVGGGEFALDHCVLAFDTDTVGHAINGAFCDGEPFIFDSNSLESVSYDWRSLPDAPEYYKQMSHMVGGFNFIYVVYVRKKLIHDLERMPETQVCLMDYTFGSDGKTSKLYLVRAGMYPVAVLQNLPVLARFVHKVFSVQTRSLRSGVKMVLQDGDGAKIELHIRGKAIYMGDRQVGRLGSTPMLFDGGSMTKEHHGKIYIVRKGPRGGSYILVNQKKMWV